MSQHVAKLVALGDGGVGKTTLIKNQAKKHAAQAKELKESKKNELEDSKKDLEQTIKYFLEESTLTTLGTNFTIQTYSVKDGEIKLQVWDIAGSPGFQRVTPQYFHGAKGALLVLNASETNRKGYPTQYGEWTVENTFNYWLNQLEEHFNKIIRKKSIDDFRKKIDRKDLNDREIGELINTNNDYYQSFEDLMKKNLKKERNNFVILILSNKMDLEDSIRDEDILRQQIEEYTEILITKGYSRENIYFEFTCASENHLKALKGLEIFKNELEQYESFLLRKGYSKDQIDYYSDTVFKILETELGTDVMNDIYEKIENVYGEGAMRRNRGYIEAREAAFQWFAERLHRACVLSSIR